MKEMFAAAPFLVIVIAGLVFAFAVIMQPIFVWMICSRLKKANKLLGSIDGHLATLSNNKTRPIVRPYSGPPGKVMAER